MLLGLGADCHCCDKPYRASSWWQRIIRLRAEKFVPRAACIVYQVCKLKVRTGRALQACENMAAKIRNEAEVKTEASLFCLLCQLLEVGSKKWKATRLTPYNMKRAAANVKACIQGKV